MYDETVGGSPGLFAKTHAGEHDQQELQTVIVGSHSQRLGLRLRRFLKPVFNGQVDRSYVPHPVPNIERERERRCHGRPSSLTDLSSSCLYYCDFS